METAHSPIAFLGPEGTFAHLVAKQRYGNQRPLISCSTVAGVFDCVKECSAVSGVVPIENSSGGTITDTVDLLIENADAMGVEEELSVDVKLALVGHRDRKIRFIYSHFAPLHHYKAWLKRNLPDAEQRRVSSTAVAAQAAAEAEDSAALSTRDAAARYGLDVLKFPVEEEDVNVTHFFSVGLKRAPESDSTKTALVVELDNSAGALYSFLEPFARTGVNMTRIVSRPVPGQPNTYVFFVEVDGIPREAKLQQALAAARTVSREIKDLGSYRQVPRYQS